MARPGGRPAPLGVGLLAALALSSPSGAASLATAAAASAGRSPAGKTDVATPPRILAVRPRSGPAAGGTNAAFYGLNFTAGTTIAIGGVPATGLSLADPTRLDAVTPALAPGSVNDVVVTVPGSAPVTLTGGWFARFLDVPPTHLFAKPIEKLRRLGITAGCLGGNFCPEDAVTRAQMAIFILRGKHGSGYHPPPATGTVFDDVPVNAFAADWIEQFAAEGITTGCGVKLYCPNNSVTRGEMAVFLLRARHGSAHNPPVPTGVFLDVPPGAPFAKWIEELAGEAITTGCGVGTYCPTAASTRGQMAVFLTKAFARSAREMIADDLAAGDIDYETSLLDRFYALFADERLPAKYQPAPNDGEDSGLFEEVQEVFSDLSPGGQAALAPFLARPDDPASVFGPAPSPGVVRRPDDGGAMYCPTTWTDSSAPGSHFVIHLCSSGNTAADDAVRAGINTIADSLWAPMTAAPSAGMGPPIGDCYTPQGGAETCPGGDGKIDVYIVNTNECFKRNGHCWPLSDTGVARAVACEPEVGNKKSGYMLLSKARVADTAKIKTDFAHEFFHVLQFAHNRKAMAYDTGVDVDGERLIVNNWYVESSATWSEWHFVPASAPDEVHWRFEQDFQPSHKGLLAYDPSDHPYAAYIWSFFAQQEKSTPGVVFDAWVAAEGASRPEGITDAVDQQLKFADHFRDFAVRNWNEDLPGHPLDKLYKDLKASDGSSPAFPEEKPAIVGKLRVTRTGERVQTQHVKLESLAAQYDDIEVDDDVKKVILRFDDLPGEMDVDLLVEIDSADWERKKVEKDKPVVFCREKAAEKVTRIIVVTGNHDKGQGHVAEGDYEIERRKSCCTELGEATSVLAHVTFDYVGSAPVGDDTIYATQSGNLTATLYPVLPLPVDSISFQSALGGVAGSATVHDLIDYESGDSTSLDGTGAPTENSTIALYVDLKECTCTFGAGPYVNATSNPGGAIGPAGVGSVAGDGISVKNFADVISGGGGFPAHSPSGAQPGHNVYIPGGLGILMFADPANENGAGSAAVTYSFEPEIPEEDLATVEPKK